MANTRWLLLTSDAVKRYRFSESKVMNLLCFSGYQIPFKPSSHTHTHTSRTRFWERAEIEWKRGMRLTRVTFYPAAIPTFGSILSYNIKQEMTRILGELTITFAYHSNRTKYFHKFCLIYLDLIKLFANWGVLKYLQTTEYFSRC